MAKLVGRLKSVGVGVESTSGTAVAATYWVPDMEFSHQDKNTKAVDTSTYGRIEEATDADIVEQWSEGSLTGVLRDTHIGGILKATFGSVSSAAKNSPNGSVYDHTFTVLNTNTHPSLSIVSKDANEDLRFAYGMVDKFSINYELGKLIEYTVDFKAKKGASTSSTVSYSSTENKFRPQDVTFKVASAVAGLSGASAVTVKSLKLTIEKNTDVQYGLGSVDVDGIFNRNFACNVEIGLLYNDTTWKAFDTDNTKRAMSIALTRSDVTIGSSANPGLVFAFQPGYFADWTKNISQNELIDQTIVLHGLYSLGQTSMVSAVLTNLATSIT